MKLKAYLLIFDGMADWEAAHALCEINKSGKYEVVTVGFSAAPVSTMGGLRIVPEATIKDVNPDEACIFIMPGGDIWERNTDEEITILLRRLNARQVPIGAICGATLAIARVGLTRERRHTSNAKEYLKTMVPGYEDEGFYVDELAVADQKIITASGLGSVEFRARDHKGNGHLQRSRHPSVVRDVQAWRVPDERSSLTNSTFCRSGEINDEPVITN